MGEIVRRTQEEQIEIDNQVLALKEAGWTQREITKELGISSKSIQPCYERAIARIPIPDKETVQRENIVQIRTKMDDINRRLANPDLPITATNVPNLIHQWGKLRADLNKTLEVGIKTKMEFGMEGSLFEIIQNNPAYYEGIIGEVQAENDQKWDAAKNYGDDVGMDDMQLDPADGVYKLPSEIKDDAKGDA